MSPESDIFAKAEFFESILNTLTTGIFVCDEKFIVRFINAAYASYLGISREEILGRPITDFIPDSRAPFVTTSGQAVMGELRIFKGPQGDRRHGGVMLEDRMQADHCHLRGVEGGGDPLRLRQAVADATGAEYLEHLDRQHLAAEPVQRQRLVGVQPFLGVTFGHHLLHDRHRQKRRCGRSGSERGE